jgi:hypothetical protein
MRVGNRRGSSSKRKASTERNSENEIKVGPNFAELRAGRITFESLMENHFPMKEEFAEVEQRVYAAAS